MRLLTRGRVISAVIVVVLLAINVVALRWSTGFFSFSKSSRALLRYGDRLPDLKGKSLIAKETVEFAKNQTNLILYFSAANPPGFSTELVKFSETLSQRHKKDGLGITAIVEDEITDLKTLLDHGLVTYDVIIDESRQIQDQLGLQPGEDGVFFFDKEGVCRFSTRRPIGAGDLRQLVAMEFLKSDPFEIAAESGTVLKEGSSFGSFSLLDARTLAPASMHEIRSKAGVPTHYIFFTAACSLCSLPQYLEEFRLFRIKQLESDNDAALIFDFNFPRTDLLEQLRSNDIKSPAYIAREQLPELEYTNQQHRRRLRTVAVIQTDPHRKILNVSPLNSYKVDRNVSTVSGTKRPAGPLYEEMFGPLPSAAYDVAAYQGKYFLTDFGGNRLIVINDKMEAEKNFGRMGSGPGRVFHPGYVDIGHDGTIFVQDGGNERIVKFDQAGNYLGAFTVAEFEGFAVGGQNELYLGQPENGHLITVYSSSGEKLRSFGQLKKFSDIYGAASRDKDDPFKIAFNRVRLATDKDRNLYVSFMLTPLIQKYSPNGALLFERRLEAPEIDRLMDAIQQKKFIATKSDQADARIIALDPVVDPANGNIMVPLVDGSIYVADREGNKLTLLRPTWTNRPNGKFYPFIAGLGAKGELMVTPFPPKRWYRLAVHNNDSNVTTALSTNEQTVGSR